MPSGRRLAPCSRAGPARSSDQLSRWHEPARPPRPTLGPRGTGGRTVALRDLPTLDFFNGLGGFDVAAREYITVLKDAEWTPAPWTNVIANPQFGFLVSADGTGTHVVDQCPAEPADAVVQRSGRQRPCGSRLHPRRGLGRALERHAPADSRAGDPMWCAMASATAGSSTPRAILRRISCSSFRGRTPSRYRGSSSPTARTGSAGSPSRTMPSGCSAISAAGWRPSS